VKRTRIWLLLVPLFLCLSAPAVGQSNGKRDYNQQHKDGEKYQKHLMKERRKQEKAQAKMAHHNRKRHQQ
jgi:hypothetical protein